MKTLAALLTAGLFVAPCPGADFKIVSFNRSGNLTWTNAFTNGICTVETAESPAGPWMPQQNFYTTSSVGRASVTASADRSFCRVLASDISTNTPFAFSNLVNSYGILSTVAGLGQFGTDVLNFWQPEFEGGPATAANLSRPHFAMADDAGNIYIADKDSHSILKVTPDGTIHTVAGTHEGGFNGDGPTNGTSLQLNFPNGLWVRGDGTVYILDTDNGKVRRLGTNGIMTTMFTVSGGIDGGRGLWVKDDEALVYFASLKDLRKRTPGGGVSTLNNNFTELGNIVVDRSGNIIATDRGDHSVWRVTPSGGRTRIAGNRDTTGGGDGSPALQTGLDEVRGVWLLPNNGYLLATHKGSRIWYVDPAGIIHLFLDGAVGGFHSGDGEWFYSPGFKVSEVRSVTMDRQGHILIVENDVGYVRKIQFLRLEQ